MSGVVARTVGTFVRRTLSAAPGRAVPAIDDAGRELGTRTTSAATSDDDLGMVCWAEQFGPERTQQ